MDGSRFDSMARALATGASRRSVLKGLLGLGGAAATGSVAAGSADARALRTRNTIPPPKPPACPLPSQMCGGECCPPGGCRDGLHCCKATPESRWCGNGCCDSGLCSSSGACCDADDHVCGSICCSAEAACARSGNTDICCDPEEGGYACGLECCSSELQCCDRECCAAGSTCLTRVFPESRSVEEACCPTAQVCDGQCCDGDCYFPDAVQAAPVSDFDRLCCPAGMLVCENADSTRSCIDPSMQCCDDSHCGECEVCGANNQCEPNADHTACGGEESGRRCCSGVCCAEGNGCRNGSCCISYGECCDEEQCADVCCTGHVMHFDDGICPDTNGFICNYSASGSPCGSDADCVYLEQICDLTSSTCQCRPGWANQYGCHDCAPINWVCNGACGIIPGKCGPVDCGDCPTTTSTEAPTTTTSPPQGCLAAGADCPGEQLCLANGTCALSCGGGAECQGMYGCDHELSKEGEGVAIGDGPLGSCESTLDCPLGQVCSVGGSCWQVCGVPGVTPPTTTTTVTSAPEPECTPADCAAFWEGDAECWECLPGTGCYEKNRNGIPCGTNSHCCYGTCCPDSKTCFHEAEYCCQPMTCIDLAGWCSQEENDACGGTVDCSENCDANTEKCVSSDGESRCYSCLQQGGDCFDYRDCCGDLQCHNSVCS